MKPNLLKYMVKTIKVMILTSDLFFNKRNLKNLRTDKIFILETRSFLLGNLDGFIILSFWMLSLIEVA